MPQLATYQLSLGICTEATTNLFETGALNKLIKLSYPFGDLVFYHAPKVHDLQFEVINFIYGHLTFSKT